MATDSEAAAAGFNVPTDADTLVSALPSIIRQNARAGSPGAWANLTLAANHAYDTTTTGPNLQIRETPWGYQIRGRRLRSTATIAKDGPIATVPTAYRPPQDITFTAPCQRAGSGNPGATLILKLKADTGQVQYVDAPASSNTALTGGSYSGDYITINNVLLGYA